MPHRRLSQVTDAIGAMGLPDGEYDLGELRVKKAGESWLTAAIPMENPCCGCELTRVRSRCRPAGGAGRDNHTGRGGEGTRVTRKQFRRLSLWSHLLKRGRSSGGHHAVLHPQPPQVHP